MSNAPSPHRTDWFCEAHWGVLTHYLTEATTTAEEWNRQVDNFDVPGLAAQLGQIGTKYYYMTIGQNSGHYCSPNATYDSFVGVSPSKCSRRDLVAELADALAAKGIRQMVYLPAGAPRSDPAAIEGLEYVMGPYRKREFQLKWNAVIAEWSRRWGRNVWGWWFDGCYWPNTLYRMADPPNFETFAAAARAGNPDSIVAFNPGVINPLISVTPHEDYTAGEMNNPFEPNCKGRWLDGEQVHMLSYLGPWWGQGPPRFTNERALEVTRHFAENGCVLTWDVPITTEGLIPQPFVDQLIALREGLADLDRPS